VLAWQGRLARDFMGETPLSLLGVPSRHRITSSSLVFAKRSRADLPASFPLFPSVPDVQTEANKGNEGDSPSGLGQQKISVKP